MQEIETTRESVSFDLKSVNGANHGVITLYVDEITKLEPTSTEGRFAVSWATGYTYADVSPARAARVYEGLARAYRAKADAEAAPVTAIK